MCGICGVYGHVGLKEKEALYHLQLFSQLRGMDSTGVAIIHDKKEAELVKQVGGLESLIDSNPKHFDWRDNNISAVMPRCVMSHHRKATIGSVNVENAHPFEYDSIIGCHNGTIFKHELKTLKSFKDELIDSQIVLEEINRTGQIKDVLPEISGAWAFCWWDKANKSLNFCRNDKRTVFIAYSQDMKTMFWASEDWMLHTALKRSGVKYNGKVGRLNVDRHFTFELGKKNEIELTNVEVAEGKPYTHPNTTPYKDEYWQVGFRPRPHEYNSHQYKGPKEENKGGQVIPLPDKEEREGREEAFKKVYVEGFGGRFLPKRRYLHLVKEGCAYCTTPLSWEDARKVRWLSHEEPLCPKCAAHFQEELDQAEQANIMDNRKAH